MVLFWGKAVMADRTKSIDSGTKFQSIYRIFDSISLCNSDLNVFQSTCNYRRLSIHGLISLQT